MYNNSLWFFFCKKELQLALGMVRCNWVKFRKSIGWLRLWRFCASFVNEAPGNRGDKGGEGEDKTIIGFFIWGKWNTYF